ncbi:MAG TPA: YchJ family protein [Pyrinomonadaceae bacterium]|jgi:SEC-C motif-containing protein|nr:YchJ family protein [Pyrinomonadaceae bacterium]
MTENNETCPCGSGRPFSDCCEPIISGTRESETAEELMRARYSAFVTGAIDFIVSSTHSRTRKEIDLPFIREWSETSTWRGLEIFETKVVNENKAFVSFEARFTQKGEDLEHREKSLFEREEGQWRFVTGDELKNPTVRYETPKPGRNDPCPCGSGKKYKKCHGN